MDDLNTRHLKAHNLDVSAVQMLVIQIHTVVFCRFWTCVGDYVRQNVRYAMLSVYPFFANLVCDVNVVIAEIAERFQEENDCGNKEGNKSNLKE